MSQTKEHTMHPRYDDLEIFMMDLHAHRRANQNKWFYYSGAVCGVRVGLKSYGTGWLQIFKLDEIDQAPPMEMSVKEWDRFIADALKEKIDGQA